MGRKRNPKTVIIHTNRTCPKCGKSGNLVYEVGSAIREYYCLNKIGDDLCLWHETEGISNKGRKKIKFCKVCGIEAVTRGYCREHYIEYQVALNEKNGERYAKDRAEKSRKLLEEPEPENQFEISQYFRKYS